MKQYRSFLIRWWDLQSGEQRIEVESLQSGKRAIVTTTAAVVDCIETWGIERDRKEVQAIERAQSEGNDDAEH